MLVGPAVGAAVGAAVDVAVGASVGKEIAGFQALLSEVGTTPTSEDQSVQVHAVQGWAHTAFIPDADAGRD